MTCHNLKLAVVQTSKRGLAAVTPINKYKILKEINVAWSCIATAKKHVVNKNTVLHWLKKKAKIFKAAEGNNLS